MIRTLVYLPAQWQSRGSSLSGWLVGYGGHMGRHVTWLESSVIARCDMDSSPCDNEWMWPHNASCTITHATSDESPLISPWKWRNQMKEEPGASVWPWMTANITYLPTEAINRERLSVCWEMLKMWDGQGICQNKHISQCDNFPLYHTTRHNGMMAP